VKAIPGLYKNAERTSQRSRAATYYPRPRLRRISGREPEMSASIFQTAFADARLIVSLSMFLRDSSGASV
jgi:hypothetical protein